MVTKQHTRRLERGVTCYISNIVTVHEQVAMEFILVNLTSQVGQRLGKQMGPSSLSIEFLHPERPEKYLF